MKPGLGRGLDSLLKSYDEEVEETRGKVSDQKEMKTDEMVDIIKIYPNPNQPRKVFDDESLNELAESIKVHGLIQPIIVNETDKGYMIIAGERRYRACKLAGVEKVNVIVKKYSDKQVAEIALIENLQREDLNPIEMAKGIRRLMDEYGLTQEKTAERLGKSRSAIANTIRILNLYPEVIDLIEKGKVSFGHAKVLVAVTDYATQLMLAKKVAKDKLTVRDLEREVEAYLGKNKKKKAKPATTAELRDFVDNLQRRLGTKVNLIGNNKKGRIYIDYYTEDDLDRIYDIILRQ